MESKLLSELRVDDPIPVNANYKFGPADREYIDAQIRTIQQVLVDQMLKVRHGSYFDLAGSSGAASAGQAVCLAGGTDGQVTLCTTSSIATAFVAVGIVVSAASPGGKVFVAHSGLLPPSITGLAAGAAGYVRVNLTTSKLERVASLSGGDIAVGVVDSAGWMLISPISSTGGGGGGSAVGEFTQAMADTNQTVSPTNAANAIITTTGVLTADRTLTLPVPANAAANTFRVIRNQCTGANLVVSVGVGPTLTIGPGLDLLVLIRSTGVEAGVTGVPDGAGAGAANPGDEFVANLTTTTTNATPAVMSLPLANASGYEVIVRVLATRTNTSATVDRFVHELTVKTTGGVATVLDDAVLANGPAASGYAVSVAAGVGPGIDITVTGATGHNVTWSALCKYRQLAGI